MDRSFVWKNRAEDLVRNSRKMLELAGETGVIRFIDSLPRCNADLDDPDFRKGFCYMTCQKAYAACKAEADELVEYFFITFVCLPRIVQKMLREIVMGTVEGLQ